MAIALGFAVLMTQIDNPEVYMHGVHGPTNMVAGNTKTLVMSVIVTVITFTRCTIFLAKPIKELCPRQRRAPCLVKMLLKYRLPPMSS